MNILSTTLTSLILLFCICTINAATLHTDYSRINTFTTGNDSVPDFTFQGADVCMNDEFSIPVMVKNFELVTSFQFTINWNNLLMNFDTVISVDPSLSNNLLFGDNSAEDGILTVSWFDSNVQGVNLPDSAFAFVINFTAVGENQMNSDITFENSPTAKEVSAYVDDEIQLVDAVYNSGAINIVQPELESVVITNDYDNSNTGSIDITVMSGTAPFYYQWSNDAQTEDLVDVGAGDYSLIVTDSKGCETDFGTFTVDNVVNTREINSLQSVFVYPNPAADQVHLTANFNQSEAIEISIFNILGQRVYNNYQESDNIDTDLNLANLENGNYFLRLSTSKGLHTEKIQIMR